MNLYKHRRYKISFDSTKTYIGSQPSDVDIPIFYNNVMASNADKIQMVTLKITWTNPNPLMPAIWAVKGFTFIRADNTTETTTTSPIYIVPSEDITISVNNLILVTQAVSIEEEETFEILCMQNSAEQERVNKRTYLSLLRVMSGTLRESSSAVNPQITFEWEPVEQPLYVNMGSTPNFNYVYIPIFGRFYFVNGFTFISKNLWVMELNVDVLMSYNNEIRQQTAYIDRQENIYDDELVDDEIDTHFAKGIYYQVITPTTQIFPVTQSEEDTRNSYLVTVVKG